MTNPIEDLEKKVIIEAMMTKTHRRPREKGHHRGDDDQTPSKT
ncbi:hypothetical protein [Bacillus sp. X1(2014)]|nr:hypothetical protein [Bacillus sp. X1(2014)]